jgi:hypothetical protein
MSDEMPSFEKLKEMPDHEILILAVQKLRSVSINLCNHLKHHEEREKEDRKFNRSLKLVAISSLITGSGSLIVALILLAIRYFL